MSSVRAGRYWTPLKRLGYVALIVAWALFLRPQWLGGSATFILVRGDSMVPTFHNGDFLIAYGQPTYEPSDIVVYRVPAGEVGAGHMVVHRIVGVSATGYTIQGDNNPASDPWTATNADVAGRVAIAVPGVGMLLALVLQPTMAGGLAAAAVVMYAVSRSTAPKPARPKRSRLERQARAMWRRSPIARPWSRARNALRYVTSTTVTNTIVEPPRWTGRTEISAGNSEPSARWPR